MSWIDGLPETPTDHDVIVALRDFDSPVTAIDRARSMTVLLTRMYTDDLYRVGGRAFALRDTLVERFAITLLGPTDVTIPVNWHRDSSYIHFQSALGLYGGSKITSALWHATWEADRKSCDSRADDFAVCVGAAAFFLTDYKESSITVPWPLVDRLHKIATRPCTPEELALNALLAGEGPWHAQHLSAPWIARRVLARLQTPWWNSMAPEAARHAAGLLVGDPARWSWIAEAIALSAEFTTPEIAAITHSAWRRLEAAPRTCVQVGLGAISAMVDHDRFFSQVAAVDGTWRAWFLFHAARITRGKNRPFEERAAEALVTLAEDRTHADTERMAALAWWLRWVNLNRSPERSVRAKAFRADPAVDWRLKGEIERVAGK